MYFIFFSVLACLLTCQCSIENGEKNENNCGSLKQWLQSTSVSVEINNKGFHREVVTTVELSPDAFNDIRVLLVHRWPCGVYVDPYQLESLSNQRDWQILIDSAIDLEVPAHKTSGFVTYIYLTLNKRTSRLLKVSVPVHGRYHEPSLDGRSASVDIDAPELLLWTGTCTELEHLEPHSVVDAPCTAANSSTCPWVKIQHQQGHNPISLQFPVGDGSLVTHVCGVTLLVTMICCAAISKFMWKHRII